MSTRGKPKGYGLAPARSPQVRWLGILLSLLLLALGALALRELLVLYRPPSGWTSWVEPAPSFLQSLEPVFVGIAGGVAALIGLWFFIASLSPRKKRHRPLQSEHASMWLRPVDLARYSTASAIALPGVINARSTAKHKAVAVDASVVDPSEETRARIRESLEKKLTTVVGSNLKIRVKVNQAGPSDRDFANQKGR